MKYWIKQMGFCILMTASVITGCSAQNDTSSTMDKQMREMKSAEARANERASNELVAFMSFDTMFADSQLRALARAAGKGQIERVRSLVDQGADVNAQGARGATALFWAMREGSVRGFRTLLELGANPNIVFEDGGTVMHWAVRNGSPAYLEAVLEHDGNPNLKAGQFNKTPLFEALGERRDRLDLLFAAGANVNADSDLGTPAYVAARRGSFDVVYRLLEHGADYRMESSAGQTLIEIAVEKKSMMDPSHELYRWLERVIDWLEARGEEVSVD
ncbi:MAG: ankyrin repeat domain-containing protein [Wenzhouxiangellaceae bacterium]